MKTSIRNYWIAFALMALNPVIHRSPETIVPIQWLQSELFLGTLVPLFTLFSFAYCMYATFCIFEDKGVDSGWAVLNAMASPFAWAFIMIIYNGNSKGKRALSSKFGKQY